MRFCAALLLIAALWLKLADRGFSMFPLLTIAAIYHVGAEIVTAIKARG